LAEAGSAPEAPIQMWGRAWLAPITASGQRFSGAAFSYGLLAFAASGYSVGVALPLAIAGAVPMPAPFLRIPDTEFFYWGVYFYAPVIVAAWLLASATMFVLASALGGVSDFSKLLRLTALASGIGTCGTLLSDLVTSPLRAAGVIDERLWEASIASHGGWYWFIWSFLILYVPLFVVGYPIVVRRSTHLSWVSATAVGVLGFLVFQGFEYVFIR
jgi:hypothetical protein